eukprot:423196_1
MSENEQHINKECNNTFNECSCANRIKLLLHQYATIILDENNKTHQQLQHDINQLMNKIVSNDLYSDVELLNDFHHLKYQHHINDNPNTFNLFYQYLFNNNVVLQCDINNCQSVQRHYNQTNRYRSCMFRNRTDIDTKDTYSLTLISRIHTYFIHAHDISHLTHHEIEYVEKQLNECKQSDEHILNDKRLELLSTIVYNKKNNSSTIVHETLNYPKISNILANNDIFIDEHDLQN